MGAVMVVDSTASLQADRRLDSGVMPVSSAYGIVDTINIKNPLNIKGDNFFDNRKVATQVGECCQINWISH